jgi:hypothetical protein
MENDDDESSNISIINQKKSFENDMYKLSESQLPTYNNQIRNRNLFINKQTTSSIQECDIPPISLKFKNELQSTDRQLINELITTSKIQHKKDLNIIGWFGYNKCLLVFAKDVDTFDDIVQESRWPEKIQESEYEIKLPRVFPPSFLLVVQHFPKNGDELETADELK